VIYKMTPDGKASVLVDHAGYTGFDPWNVGGDRTNGWDPKDPRYRFYFQFGADGLTLDKEGRIIVAGYYGRTVYRLEKNSKRTVLAERYEGKRFAGPNDLVVKRDGSIYFSETGGGVTGRGHDPNEPLPPKGVYRIKDGKVTLVVSDNPQPNGLAFSPDEKILYVTANNHIRPAPEKSTRVWLDAQAIVHGAPEFLLAPEVPLRRLNGHVPEEELDLIQLAACQVAQTGAHEGMGTVPSCDGASEWTCASATACSPSPGSFTRSRRPKRRRADRSYAAPRYVV
jgi:DNA-binding beta-propeller fold protein YncE